MYAIWWHEFNHRRSGLIGYCLAALGLLILYVAVYPSIHDASKQLEAVIKAYPQGVLKAFGIEELTFNTLEKYVAAEQFSFVWPIMAIALVLTRAGNSIAGEIERTTMGLLLSLPVTRLRLFAAKYLAGIVAIVVFTAVSVLALIPLAAGTSYPVDAAAVGRTFIVTTLFMWAVFSLAMLVSAMVSERSKVYIVVSAVLLVMYVLNVLAGVKDSLHNLRYASFNYYLDASHVLTGSPIMWRSVLVFVGVVVVCTALAAGIFNRRDMSV
jgi:ABC-2 type transport system permease protein